MNSWLRANRAEVVSSCSGPIVESTETCYTQLVVQSILLVVPRRNHHDPVGSTLPTMRVHVLQVAYGDDEPVAARVERVADLVAAQSGADLVVLPELWAPTGMGYRSWLAAAEPIDGPTVTAISRA